MDPMETIELGGILPAIVTPVRQDGALSVEAFQRLAARLYAAGVDGLYVNGQTGEGLLQPVEQRKQVAEAARAVTPPGKQLIVHVGAHRTEDAVELAPAISPGVRTLEEIERLLEIPGVIGLKFTDFDLYKLSILKRHGCRLIFNGHDEVLAAGLLLGADGGIGSFYNLIPERFVELFRLARQGQWEQARQVQQRINELVEICLRFPLIPAIKTILGWTGLPCGEALRPRRSLRVEETQQLRALLRESSFAFLLDGAA